MPSLNSKLNESHPYRWQFDQARYRRAFLHGGVDEATVQKDIKSALALLGIEAAVVDSGAAGIRGKIYYAMKKLNLPISVINAVMGSIQNVAPAPVGWSDLSGCLAPLGRAFFIEVKAPAHLSATGGVVRSAGQPSTEQKAFLDRMHKRGAIVGVAWSVEDALEILAPALPDHRLTFR